jgi:hypothetical protein
MLHLPTIRTQFPDLAEAAAREQMSYRGFLAELLMAECDDRARRRAERRIKAAWFPREKSLRAFDFDANPSIDPAVINTLATCDWVRKGLPLCLIGDSGTGNPTCSSRWAPRPPWPGSGSATPWPPNSSTSSWKPPTTGSSPRPSTATAASTCSASTYADPATMPRVSCVGCHLRDVAGVPRRLTGAGAGIVAG